MANTLHALGAIRHLQLTETTEFALASTPREKTAPNFLGTSSDEGQSKSLVGRLNFILVLEP